MELDDINSVKPIGDHETSLYENTEITSATLEETENSQPRQTENVEGLYETLTLERKSNDRKTLTLLERDTIKRIKCFLYVNLTLVIVLYIGIIALTIVVAVPKTPVDGGWSNWETWSACTDSCGGGVKTRNRSCSNPTSSMHGKQCLGNYEQFSQCNKQLCPGTDGGWSVWEDWGACTDRCGGGLRTRSRSCTNPIPSMNGRHCTGDYTDVSTCNKTACSELSAAFTAYDIYRNSSTYSILLFRRTHINVGDGYDTTTGKFTCSISGVYHFVVTLTKYYQDIDRLYAYLRINGSSKLYLFFNPKDDDSGYDMMTGAGTFHLDQNDVVDVYGVSDYFTPGLYSYFTGFLITPDQ